MSLSSLNDVKLTTARIGGPSKGVTEPKLLEHAAVLRRVRPRREASTARGTDGDPDLLECAPVVGGALVSQQPAAVPLLEAEVHLEAAPVRAARVRPAPLVVVDAEPRVELRRMVRSPPGRVFALSPGVREPAEPCDRAQGRVHGQQ